MKSIYLDDVTAAKRVASRIDKYSDVDEMLYDMNRASPPMARAAKQAMTYAKDKVKDWKYSLDRDAIDFARRAGKVIITKLTDSRLVRRQAQEAHEWRFRGL